MDPQELDSWPRGTFMAQLDAPARDMLLRLGTVRRFAPGAPLLRQGERSRHAVILLSGVVKITADTAAGRKVFFALRVRGDLVGELATLDGKPRSATVSACRGVTAREISHVDLRRFLNDRPDVWQVMTAVEASRFRAAIRERVELAGYSVRDRLRMVLAELCRSYGRDTEHGRELSVPLTQVELAAAVGCGEASLHNVLRDLREEGVLATGYRRLVILRPDQLRSDT